MPFPRIIKHHFILISSVLLSIYLVNGIIAIPQLSITYDEADHLNYAVRFVLTIAFVFLVNIIKFFLY